MRSIPEQAELIIAAILLQDAQMRAAGVPAHKRWEAVTPGVQTYLQQFQDELLESQRASAIALGNALNFAQGKR